MRIGLISDTHIPKVETALPTEIISVFKGVDLILHAGDIYDLAVLNDLECLAPVMAARGDDDEGETVIDKRVKTKHMLTLGGKKVWLTHYRPYTPISTTWFPLWWEDRTDPEQNKFGKPDIVIFGHEHRTIVQRVHGVLFVNPGSPTFQNYVRGLGTIGILNIDSDNVDVKIKNL